MPRQAQIRMPQDTALCHRMAGGGCQRTGKWSMTSLPQRLEKTGGRLIKHARYYWRLWAESCPATRLFWAMVQRIAALPVATG
jgi:hypothetical protein